MICLEDRPGDVMFRTNKGNPMAAFINTIKQSVRNNQRGVHDLVS